jgi:hypothetical protein
MYGLRARDRGGIIDGHVIDVRPKADRSEEIIDYFGVAPIEGRSLRLPPVPSTEELCGMGPLVWLEVELFDGSREKWTFSPFPRLAYHKRS